MNPPRIKKLCIPPLQHDPIWKFWQPNAKLEKIYPPQYWKPLDYKQTDTKTKIQGKNKRSCSNGCHYTTLTYKPETERKLTENDYRIFIDFEHDGLQHATWKESIKEETVKVKAKKARIDYSWLNINNQQQALNDQYLKRQELDRYFKLHLTKDKLFLLDKSFYPNRPIPISRRPHDALHIDFYQADCFKGTKTEATFKTFYHRKYLLPRCLREHILKDLISNANKTQLNIETVGHFILHPNELSKHEIQMFELTSEFGDIYEGHIIRINNEKLVLLLSSTFHSHVKPSQSNHRINLPDQPKSTFEDLILNHVEEYFQTHQNSSLEPIIHIQIELEPLLNPEKRRVLIHLLSDDKIIDDLILDITREEEPKLFAEEFQNNFYFLQTDKEQIIISSVEDKLKQLFNKRYSLIHQKNQSYLELTLNLEYDTIHSMEKMLYTYANHRLSTYSREECMRIGIEYGFDDLLDQLDSNEFQANNDNKQIQMMVDEIQRRLRLKIEQRSKAETTARILLIGPPMKKKLESVGKEVTVLDHHRTIFISRSDTHIGLPKVKNIKRNHGNVLFHEEIPDGPKSFDRLPMSIDSLTILTRIQQRKRLVIKQDNDNSTLFSSGIRRLITSDDHKQNVSSIIQSEQDKSSKTLSSHLSFDEQDDNNSMKTFDAKSYNTSAYTKFKYYKKFYRPQRKNKRLSRSLAEYGKHKQRRKKYKRYESISKIFKNKMNRKRSFFKNLFLLHQNKKAKMLIFKRNRSRNETEAKNINAKTSNSNITTSTTSSDESSSFKNSSNFQNNLFKESKEEQSLSAVGTDFDDIEEMSDETSFIDHQNKNYQTSNIMNKSIEEQQFDDEGFQDKEGIDHENTFDTRRKRQSSERYLRLLYGPLSSITKSVHHIYQSKSSQLIASLDLAHIFITFLHLRKDIAYEIATTIINKRQYLIQPVSTKKSSSSVNMLSKTYENEDIDDDTGSISSGIVTNEDSDIALSEHSSISRIFSDNNKNEDQSNCCSKAIDKINYSSKSQHIMSRITSYLSEADWRVFNYITKYFIQNGPMITIHALEFSSALLMDLIEDSVYQTYFHLKWCSEINLNLNDKTTTEYIENFLKQSIDNLLKYLQVINLPLLESIGLMVTLKKYTSTDLLREINSMNPQPIPIERDPCVWLSSEILTKIICSLTDDILNKMNQDYLSDYTKLEYLLICYFRKIEIVQNLQDVIEKHQHQTTMKTSEKSSNKKSLLHVFDLNQTPKFYSDHAFKRFKLDEQSYLNNDIEALKDLVLLNIPKRYTEPVKRSYIPLSMDDLMSDEQNRVISPSPWILAQCQRRLGIEKTHSNKDTLRKDSYQFDENMDVTKLENLPSEVRTLLNDMIRNYGTIEDNLAKQASKDQEQGLSEEEIAQLVEDAIEAVERYDREHNIGERKLQNKKTVNDRLLEFFKYAGRNGVRLLDDVLKLAKLRSNDPKKYLPLAVDMLRDRLKQNGRKRTRKRSVRFTHTIETLFIATNDEPDLIMKMLTKKSREKNLFIPQDKLKENLKTTSNSLQTILEDEDKKIDASSIESVTKTNIISDPMEMFTENKSRQTLPTIHEVIESKMSSSSITNTDEQSALETFKSDTITTETGLTVAQLLVLAARQKEEFLKLTDTQIKQ